jgi:23S rRNA pseudouridine2605 synthase
MPDSTTKVRLQRYLADAGIAARRVCEALIEQGRVEVNGRVVTKLPAFVEPDTDKVVVDGRPVKAPGRRVYIILHKPTRTLVTAADEPGFDRRTVLDLVNHPAKARLFPVGRLHYDATGLVLLTNDGEFANLLTHPRYGVPKTYWAVVRGTIVPEQIADIDLKLRILDRKAARADVGLSTGPRRRPAKAARDHDDDEREQVPLDPETGLPIRTPWEREHVAKSTRPVITIVKTGEGKTLLEISMLEARNRQLEDVLQGLGSPVKKVTRVGIGPLRLKGLGVGHWRELTTGEVTLLRKIAKRSRDAGAPGEASRPVTPRPAGVLLSRTQRQAKREKERQVATGFGEVARAIKPGRPGHLGKARTPGAAPKRRKHDEGAQ